MSEDITEIKHRILLEFEQSGQVDLKEWTGRFPQYSDEIVDFIFWAELTARIEESAAGPYKDPNQVATRAIRWAIQESFDQPTQPSSVAEDSLRVALAHARKRHVSVPKGKRAAPLPFRRAAVYTWVCSELLQEYPRPTRYAVGKISYLLEIGLDLGLFTTHKKKAAGPYDPALRYRDAEPIAVEQQRWLVAEGTSYEPGPDIDKAMQYAPRYLKDLAAARALVHYCSNVSGPFLETWTTVLMATQDLDREGRPATIDAIREHIASFDEWAAKLQKKHFTSKSIEDALGLSRRLGLIP
jgi:hypothetical protein